MLDTVAILFNSYATIALLYLGMIVTTFVITWFSQKLVLSRSKSLRAGIKSLLDTSDMVEVDGNGRDVAQELLNHPLISTPHRDKVYFDRISKKMFSLAIMDILKKPEAECGPITEFESSVASLPNCRLKSMLGLLVDDAQGDKLRIQINIELWLSNAAERISLHYRRQALRTMVVAAALLSCAFNINSFTILSWSLNESERKIHTDSIMTLTERGDFSEDDITKLMSIIDDLEFPIGWNNVDFDLLQTLQTTYGLFITIVLVTSGAYLIFQVYSKKYEEPIVI